MIDKQKLRKLAECATHGHYSVSYLKLVVCDDHLIAHFSGSETTHDEDKNNARYFMAANPQVMLSLLDELEAKDKRIAELEAKLANPVLLPKTNGYWTEQEKAYEEAITLAKRQVRLAGFRCGGDE